MNLIKHYFYFVSIAFLSMSSSSSYASKERVQNQIKAQFIYNFANYVTWPDSAFVNEKDAIDVCVFGSAGFLPYLNAFEGVLIGERELKINSTTKIENIASGCHMLFVSEAQRIQLPHFWDQISYTYVLSVGEISEFAEKGGIISIFRTSDRMRFDVNISNAINNGLFLDSDLLSLARTIKRNTEN